MKKNKKPTVLVILDGYGHSNEKKYNAIYKANTPNIDNLMKSYPNTLIKASGKAVGLLDGNIGNSEVGHLTIGAGRIIEQPVSKINCMIQDESFFSNKTLKNNLIKLSKTENNLHIMGLLSDASVHSNIEHLYGFLKTAKQNNIKNVFLHLFLDGRDVPPQSAKKYLEKLEKKIKTIGLGKIASLHGRFYAMDRNNNWEQIEKSYKILTEKQKIFSTTWQDVLKQQYKNKITDEFIIPTQLNQNGIIKNGDGIIFFNFRPDRARQITETFVNKNFNHFKINNIILKFFITPTVYSDSLPTSTILKKQIIKNTLSDILYQNRKTMFAIAETEKYAHITYFFSGGREQKLPNETCILIPSIKTSSYINCPEMSAKKITEKTIKSLNKDPKDFYLINYANADMVGHSGNIKATIKAIEFIDTQLKKLFKQIIEIMDGTLYITSDHGNAERMFDTETNQPHTAHTCNKVPFIMIQKSKKGSSKELPLKQLSDIAPFLLKNMNIPIPKEMDKID